MVTPERCAHGRFTVFGRVFVCECGKKAACRCILREHAVLEHMPPNADTARYRKQREKEVKQHG